MKWIAEDCQYIILKLQISIQTTVLVKLMIKMDTGEFCTHTECLELNVYYNTMHSS